MPQLSHLTALLVAMPFLGALLLLRSSVHILADRQTFAAVVRNYRVLPDPLATAFAALLPWSELAVGVMLIVPSTQRIASWLAATLLGVFALAIAWNVVRGRHWIECGCGNMRDRHPIRMSMVLRNLVIAGLLAAVAHGAPLDMDWTHYLLGLTAGAVAGLIYVATETLQAQMLRPRRRLAPHVRRLAWSPVASERS